jgi:hypothetical protein
MGDTGCPRGGGDGGKWGQNPRRGGSAAPPITQRLSIRSGPGRRGERRARQGATTKPLSRYGEASRRRMATAWWWSRRGVSPSRRERAPPRPSPRGSTSRSPSASGDRAPQLGRGQRRHLAQRALGEGGHRDDAREVERREVVELGVILRVQPGEEEQHGRAPRREALVVARAPRASPPGRPRPSRSFPTSLPRGPPGRNPRAPPPRPSHAPHAAAARAFCSHAWGGGDVATPSPPLATPFSPPCGPNPL